MSEKAKNLPRPVLSAKFRGALGYAARLHAKQARKGTSRPYIAHLLGVAATVLTHGGDEDEAIAALLHDAVEDQGGKPRLREIRRKFGARVARIVDGCTDSYSECRSRRDWNERKLTSPISILPTNLSASYQQQTSSITRAKFWRTTAGMAMAFGSVSRAGNTARCGTTAK